MPKVTKRSADGIGEQFAGTVRREAAHRTDRTRQELGEVVIEATERYFPEAVRQRRRRDLAVGFGAGAVVGVLAGSVLGD